MFHQKEIEKKIISLIKLNDYIDISSVLKELSTSEDLRNQGDIYEAILSLGRKNTIIIGGGFERGFIKRADITYQ